MLTTPAIIAAHQRTEGTTLTSITDFRQKMKARKPSTKKANGREHAYSAYSFFISPTSK
jgi:hypothetical protein